jgi:pectin methylesterase-like acyl-CoA thioesterase
MKRLYDVFFLLAALTAQAFADTRTLTVGPDMSHDFLSVQAAIEAATTGDAVVVYPGTYRENVRFRGKEITLRGTDPASTATVYATTLDGQSSGSVVTFAGTESERCVLAGLRIRNGKVAQGAAGGGITRRWLSWNKVSCYLRWRSCRRWTHLPS